MQSKNYSIIGGFMDVEGTCLTRVILAKNGSFLVIKSECYEGIQPYPNVISAIAKLAEINTANMDFNSTDVLCNFNESLILSIINKKIQNLRIRNTDISGSENDMVMNLLNARKSDRLFVLNSSDSSNNAIDTILNWNKAKSENPTQYSLAMALLHSVGWLEGQMIKYNMV